MRDAWNRLMKVTRAYRDPANPTLHLEGSVIGTMLYDGLGRRIEKKITNSGDWDGTYEYYHNGQQTVELHYGSIARKQYVWGTQYVDELKIWGHHTDFWVW